MTVAELTIGIGGIPILVRTDSAEFLQILENHYGGFVNAAALPVFTFNVEIVPPGRITDEEDLSVRFASGRWVLERGDFHAECDPARGQGMIRQSANHYAIDAALRIVHSLLLAQDGGLLVHAASAIRNGRAYLFAGVSGAGKTTICRLAPPDVTLLTDEISYVRDKGYGIRDKGNTKHQSPIPNSAFRIPRSEARIPNTECRAPNSERRIPNSEARLPSPEHRAPSPECLVPNPLSLTP